MQKIILSAILSSAGLVGLPSISNAQSDNGATVDNSGFFVNGQVGRVNADVTRTWAGGGSKPGDKSTTHFHSGDPGYGVNLGYRWQSFGVEVGYTNLGKFSNNVKATSPIPGLDPTVFSVVSPESKVHALTLGVNGHFNLNDNWYVSGRAGAFRFQTNGPEHVVYVANGDVKNPLKVKANETGWGPYVGIGFGYDFTRNFGIGINYDYFRGTQKNRTIKATQVSNGTTTTATTTTKLNNDLKLRSGLISVSAEYRFQ